MNMARAMVAGLMLAFALAGCGGGGSGGGGGGGSNVLGSDATLTGLSLSAAPLDQIFQSSLLDYTATAGYLATATTVTPTAKDPAATVSVNGVNVASGEAFAPIPLNVGDTTITVVVTAQDGITTESYTVTVRREPASATLSDLSLSAAALDPPFQSARFDYTATAGYLATATTVTPTVTDSAATVSVNGVTVASGTASAPIPLSVGPNTVTVVVTAQDGITTESYTVTVTREPASATLSDLSLSAAALDQTFQSSLLDYTATAVYLATATTVTPTVTDSAATVSVNGVTVASGTASAPVPLSVGTNTVTVVVTAQDGITKETYTVVVTRESALEFAQQAYLKASSTGLGDQFGYSVALSGDTLAVGAYREDSQATGINGNPADDSANDAGAVYVFTRSGTSWLQQAYLKASNAESGDRFGISLALSGDTLAVGADREASQATGINGGSAAEDDNGASGAGAVYVFTRSGTSWLQQAYIKPSNTGSDDAFGWSVALSGDTLAAGATGEASQATGTTGDAIAEADNSAPEAGAVYVFTRAATVWTQQAYLKASNTDAHDGFGYAVSLDGDTLAVGADREASQSTLINGGPAAEADNGAPNAGAVYVFIRSGGDWSQQAYVKASNAGTNDVFGWSVALDSDTLAVGAAGEASGNGAPDDNSAPSAGAAYVFTRSGTTWSQQAYVKASNREGGDLFGWSLALEGETLVAGAPREDSDALGVGGNPGDNSRPDSGAVYLFRRNAATWSQDQYVKAAVTDDGDLFGYSVALSGDSLAAGAPGEDSIDGNPDDNSQSGAGAAYVFQ